MSKFLAPIHFWLYDKIKVQEELTAALADLAHEQGWDDGVDCSTYVSCDLPALDTVIDEGNIHGWLQARIGDAEGRYARLVTTLVSADPTRMEALQQAAEQFGKRHAIGAATPQDAYRCFENTLLNGMPCDRVNVLTEQEETHLAWEEAMDLHASFWEAAGGDAANYRSLRSAVMRGMLDDSGVVLNVRDTYSYELACA